MRMLTGKRIHWRTPLLLGLAAAVLAALFSGATPAQAALGDLSHNRGYCMPLTDTDGTIYPLVTILPAVPNVGDDFVTVNLGDLAPVGLNLSEILCPEEFLGRPVRLRPNGTETPDIEVIQPSLTISIDGYPDHQIPADGQVSNLRITYHDFAQTATNSAGVRQYTVIPEAALLAENRAAIEGVQHSVHLDFVRAESVPGVVAPLVPPAVRNITAWGQTTPPDPLSRPRSIYYPGFYVIPGATGEFTVTARVDYDYDLTASNVGQHVTLYATQTFTIVDPTQNNLSAAELSLFGAVDNPLTSLDETRPGTDTAAAAGGDIWLKLEARNAAGDLSSEIRLTSTSVIAAGATISAHARAPGGGPGLAILPAPVDNTAFLQAFPGPPRVLIPSTLFLKLTKTNGQPGEVELRAIINGDDGAATSETLTLTFTGPATKLTLERDLSIGQPADGETTQLEIPLSGVDAGGNAVAPTLVSYAVTDADGAAVPANAVTVVTRTAGASTPDDASDDGSTPAALVTVGSAAAPGTYTITASIPGIADSSDTATLLVAGMPANLEIAADETNPDRLGQVITVSAMVTDADGVAVADGSLVTFTASGTGLLTVGTDAGAAPGLQRPTAGGATLAQFTVIGAGTAVITAAIGNQTEVLVVASTAGMTAAVEEPGLHCLSKRIGFAVWSCGVESTAAMIFADLAGRGVKSIHRHDGTAWQRYSVINGQVVPGSVDFTIVEHDILYISN